MRANKWRDALEIEIRSGKLPSIFESHIAKYRSLMPSLALIFASLQSFDVYQRLPESVDLASVELAIEWCSLLKAHALKAYGQHLSPSQTSASRLLEKIKSQALQDRDSIRSLSRKGWSGLRASEDVHAGLQTLVKHGYVRIEVINPINGGRSEIIRIHPSLREKVQKAG